MTVHLAPQEASRALGWAVTAVLLAVTMGCGTGAPAPPPTIVGCADSQCVTTTSMGTIESVSPPLATASLASSPVATLLGATPVVFRSEAAVLGPVVWATAVDDETRAPADQVARFAANTPTIYATIPVERIAAGTTVQAQWSYNRTRLESFDQTIVAERSDAGVWLEFHLGLRDGEVWPSGTYEVNIAVNGVPALAGRVEVGEISP